MKHLHPTLILIILAITACTPATSTVPSPIPTPLAAAQATTQPAPISSAQIPPAATVTPRGTHPQRTPTSSDPSFIASPILGRPTDTSITVNVVPASALTIFYEYGTVSGEYSAHTAPQTAAAGTPLETLIDRLQPNTRYYYRIRYGDKAGPESRFVTQRAPGSTFTFGIQGDSHPERLKKQFDPALYTRTLLSAAADQPDFYMTIGDDFSVDALKTVNAETVRSQYINQRKWLELVGAPVFLVNGNHEQAAQANLNGTADNVAVWAQTARNAYYPQPAPDTFYTGDAEPVTFIGQLRDYYAFTWGDALFVVIDPYWHSAQTVDNQFGGSREDKKNRDLWNVTLGDAQYQWFRHTLETSTSPYTFVFAHHVNGTGRGGIELAGSYEWGDAAHLAAHRPGWDKTIHQLMVDNGVTVFFQGHDHIFARQELDGVIYQTLPEPANPNDTYENTDAYTTGDKFPNSGHVRVTVAPDGVTVEYIRSYLNQPDERAFAYTIPPSGADAAIPTTQPSSASAVPATTQPTQSPVADQPSSAVSLILGRPTSDSITASLLSATGQQVSLDYGTAPGIYPDHSSPVSLQANAPQDVELSRLTPDTTYYYRLIVNSTPQGEHRFHTQRAPGSDFSFTIDADPHNRDPRFTGDLYATTLANALADRPDFHINLGDTFMTEKAKPQTYADAEATFTEMRPYFGVLGADVPLFLVNGNHEGELGWLLGSKDNTLPIWSTQLRQRYYPNPTPNSFYTGSATLDAALGAVRDGYYAWTWGDALFIVLDPFWYTTTKPKPENRDNNWSWTLGKEQYDWLASTLETSNAQYTFIFTHHLVGGGSDARGGIEEASFYEWGGNNADGTYGFTAQRPGWGKPIHQLLVEHHVSAVFHGHDHVFVKQDLDGIVYQELPQPSMANDNNTRIAADYGYTHGDVLGSSGHLRVTVTPEQVTVAYVRAYLPKDTTPDRQNGQVDYQYTLSATR